MIEIAHTMPFMLLQEPDLKMADECLKSLSRCDMEAILVIYNQGCFTNDQLELFLKSYEIEHIILGRGTNIGISAARQCCFEYIWSNLKDIRYITEIHVDMIFPPNWMSTLVSYLDTAPDPMIAPGIMTVYGELHPDSPGIKSIDVPQGYKDILSLLPGLTSDVLKTGFVHPVIHKSEILKEIGGYDTRFLTGQQGYEDDSLLLGYRYHMGISQDWKPKAYLKTRVYHRSLAQRMYLPDVQSQCDKNLEGLIRQYGVYGLLQLSRLHGNKVFEQIALSRI